MRTERWITAYPRFDRGALARLGVLDPGSRTSWALKEGPGVANPVHVELAAAADGLEITTGNRVQVVRYWYDSALPHGGLRQFFCCPCCSRICRSLYFDGYWGCRSCLQLRYPIRSAPAGRSLAVHQIADLRRGLLSARPGSRRWHELRAQVTQQYAVLSSDVARIRRDLKRRLANDYKRK
jgi:hypothetical protein